MVYAFGSWPALIEAGEVAPKTVLIEGNSQDLGPGPLRNRKAFSRERSDVFRCT